MEDKKCEESSTYVKKYKRFMMEAQKVVEVAQMKITEKHSIETPDTETADNDEDSTSRTLKSFNINCKGFEDGKITPPKESMKDIVEETDKRDEKNKVRENIPIIKVELVEMESIAEKIEEVNEKIKLEEIDFSLKKFEKENISEKIKTRIKEFEKSRSGQSWDNLKANYGKKKPERSQIFLRSKKRAKLKSKLQQKAKSFLQVCFSNQTFFLINCKYYIETGRDALVPYQT